MTNKKNVIVLAGPTACGKSATAMGWAQNRFDGKAVIINADSQQVYKEIPIISAQPSLEEQKDVKHTLYGFLSVKDHYSAQDWREDAIQAIDEAYANDLKPIVVGGSGFYLQALIKGFSPIPTIPLETRRRVTRLYEDMGPESFHGMIMEKDKSASQIHPHDKQRCVRLWEVYQETGKPLSYWQSQPLTGPPDNMYFDITVMMPEREALYELINLRFERMLKNGALDEVKALYAMKDLDPMMDSIQACGIPQLYSFLKGDLDWDTAVEKAKQSSRHYAKRQYTWFRNQLINGTDTPIMNVSHLK